MPKHAQVDDAELIQGTWEVVEYKQVGPESLKVQRALVEQGVYRIFITADKMIHSPDQSEEAYRLDTARKPKVLEMLKDGKVIAKAIYELKGDDLKFCQVRALRGDEVPEPPDGFDVKKYKAGTLQMLFVLKREHAKKAEALYDFRASPRYRALPAGQRQSLEQVNHDFALLWGALDLYAGEHGRMVPEKLDALVPRYLKELPKDPFATRATAEEKKLGPYVASRDGWGYRYRPGRGNYSFVLASVGLPGFPYLAPKGNVGLHRTRGLWLSGLQPVRMK